jgi:hypothetical protein
MQADDRQAKGMQAKCRQAKGRQAKCTQAKGRQTKARQAKVDQDEGRQVRVGRPSLGKLRVDKVYSIPKNIRLLKKTCLIFAGKASAYPLLITVYGLAFTCIYNIMRWWC